MKTPSYSYKTYLIKIATLLFISFNTYAADPDPARSGWSDTASTGAAMGYCLANHPYLSVHRGSKYTPDGFETVSAPGIVGAVRRNFIWDRSTDAKDQGKYNNCSQACAEFGKQYSGLNGRPLHQILHNGTVITSGLGDIGSLVYRDVNFYDVNRNKHVSGMWSRGNTWHESDVAQSDYCCCQTTYDNVE